MKVEVATGEPCGDVGIHRFFERFDFNPSLTEWSFEPTDKQIQGVRQWEQGMEEFADSFLGLVSTAPKIFPGIASTGTPLSWAYELCKGLPNKADEVREFYRRTKPQGFPPAESIDNGWAIYRRYEVLLAAVAEFYARYGPDREANRKKIVNERLDLDHTAVALLVGRLASRDRTMIRRFEALSDGEVIR
jgi:hypothetical protein